MSKLSFIEQLLAGCKAEWKTLGDVAIKISSGGTPKTDIREYWEGGTIPWMSSGEVNFETIYATENFITEAGLKNSSAKFVPKNSLVIALAGQGKTRGKVARTRIDLTTNQSLASIVVNQAIVNSDYLYHFLKTQYENLRQISSGSGTRGGLNLQMISNYKIPLPCPENPKKSLEIQAEIVRILDAFTAHTTELTAELTARKKQYNHYRDKLLSFEEGEVEWRTLGEVGKIHRGTAITKKQTSPGNYPVIANGPSHNYFHNQSNRSGETIVIARSGAYAGLVSYWDIPFFLTDAFSIHPENDRLCTKFLYYVLKNNQTQIHNMGAGAGVPHVRATDFESYKVPVPSLEEQNRIVSILDKFDALTNSITEGLPREIELRQKQYEYYRDLLLSFPKPEQIQAAT